MSWTPNTRLYTTASTFLPCYIPSAYFYPLTRPVDNSALSCSCGDFQMLYITRWESSISVFFKLCCTSYIGKKRFSVPRVWAISLSFVPHFHLTAILSLNRSFPHDNMWNFPFAMQSVNHHNKNINCFFFNLWLNLNLWHLNLAVFVAILIHVQAKVFNHNFSTVITMKKAHGATFLISGIIS